MMDAQMTTQNATVSDGKKSHRATSNHDRRRARQDQHASRLGAKRTTRRTPQEIFDKIRSLLLLGRTQMEVKDTLRDQGYEISLGPIGKVAFELEASGRINQVRRKREGMNKGGRPRGEGKKFSPNRARVLAHKLSDPSLTSREIGLMVGITRQAVDRILNDFRKLAVSDGEMKNFGK